MMPQKESQTRWENEHTTRMTFKFNHNTDADIIDYLNSVPSKLGAVKSALRDQMAKNKKEEND